MLFGSLTTTLSPGWSLATWRRSSLQSEQRRRKVLGFGSSVLRSCCKDLQGISHGSDRVFYVFCEDLEFAWVLSNLGASVPHTPPGYPMHEAAICSKTFSPLAYHFIPHTRSSPDISEGSYHQFSAISSPLLGSKPCKAFKSHRPFYARYETLIETFVRNHENPKDHVPRPPGGSKK